MRAIWNCPILAAGEEIDDAIEHTRSVVEMALDLGDPVWAAQVGKVYRLLVSLREQGLGREPENFRDEASAA